MPEAKGRSVKIRGRAVLADKFKRHVEVAGPDYEYGVKNPVRTWIEEFEAAVSAIQEGMRKAAEELRFLAGAKRVGQKKWADNTGRKGPARWRDETPKRADEWHREFNPFAEELEKLVLEAKGPKGDPRNVDIRVKPVVSALVKKKREIRGLGT
jgi:hypothetical protein